MSFHGDKYSKYNKMGSSSSSSSYKSSSSTKGGNSNNYTYKPNNSNMKECSIFDGTKRKDTFTSGLAQYVPPSTNKYETNNVYKPLRTYNPPAPSAYRTPTRDDFITSMTKETTQLLREREEAINRNAAKRVSTTNYYEEYNKNRHKYLNDQ